MTPRHDTFPLTSPLPEEPLRSPDERRADALMDGGGFPAQIARALIGGPDDSGSNNTHDSLSVVSAATVAPRRISRRGGRAYPEVPDSAADPHWSTAGPPLSHDESQTLRGHAADIRDMLQKQERANAANPDELRYVLARQMAEQLRRSR